MATPEIIDANYRIRVKKPFFGKAPAWIPARVYNTGGAQVFIDMPPALSTLNAPIIHVLDAQGKEMLVNYRLQHHRYSVDGRFQKALLVSGSGSHREEVLITYQGKVP